MKLIYFLLIMLTFFFGTACKTATKTTHNSRNASNWSGTYSGITPCADCEGIATTLVLNPDASYLMHTKYIGKPDEMQSRRGSFTWNKEGNMITLNGMKEGTAPTQYKVGENQLTQLDQQGQLISGNNASSYILTKDTNVITNKYWKLIEVMGQPVTGFEQQRREPHMILRIAENRVTGNSGCNGFSGAYQLEPNNRLRFSPLAVTKMACVNGMEVENQFLKALEMTDSYSMNGDSLQLNKARMAPLARFVAVYLK